jgi:putative ABC transport system permease protein
VAAVAPAVRGGAQVTLGNRNWATAIVGTTPDYLFVRDQTVISGNPFTPGDVTSGAKVALLGQTVVETLFGNSNPVGQSIRIKNVPFIVDGVLSAKGQSPTGQDQDDLIVIPISTAKRQVLGTTQANLQSVGALMVQAVSARAIDEAQHEMQALLRQRHRIWPGEDDDFTVRSLADVFDAQEASARVMSILLGAIASVSLIVGGIGIMNIMLVSVTERTREIGIRIAIGARKQDILSQFLVEAVALSVLGGLAGILCGIGASALISHFAGWSTLVSTGAVALAFAFFGLVGMLFGYYPARRAASLDPVEALRY